MSYLLTGDPDPDTGGKQIQDKAMKKVLLKCMAFSPKDRYGDVQQVRRALLALRPAARKRRAFLKGAACLLAFLGLVYGCVRIAQEARANDAHRAYLERAAADAAYLNERYDTDMFQALDRPLEFQDLRRLISGDAYHLPVSYTWATPPPEPPYPHEDPGNFFPWALDEHDPMYVDFVLYAMVKIYYPRARHHRPQPHAYGRQRALSDHEPRAGVCGGHRHRRRCAARVLRKRIHLGGRGRHLRQRGPVEGRRPRRRRAMGDGGGVGVVGQKIL